MSGIAPIWREELTLAATAMMSVASPVHDARKLLALRYECGRARGLESQAIARRGELSRERLAVDADLERRHVGAIEKGEESPTVATLDRIVMSLSVDIAEFFDHTKPAAKSLSGLPPGRLPVH